MDKKNANTVVCFGEILWDILPDVQRPGGAPMNVAYNLQKLGVNSSVISSVGNDELGLSLRGLVKKIGLSDQTVQIHDTQPTSEVIASIGEQHEVHYEIVFPVAWDYISWQPDHETLLKTSQALVFGSLASRNEVSAQSLLKLLDFEGYKVFDVNLRAPHYSFNVIDRLLQRADLVKLNAAELEIISQWYDDGLSNEADQINYFFNKFSFKEVLVTKGAHGASYYTPDQQYFRPAFSVTVNDTIGSGDSFLAAFLSKRLQNESPEVTLDYAIAMGAFITSKSGACPPYDKPDFETFLKEHKPNRK